MTDDRINRFSYVNKPELDPLSGGAQCFLLNHMALGDQVQEGIELHSLKLEDCDPFWAQVLDATCVPI